MLNSKKLKLALALGFISLTGQAQTSRIDSIAIRKIYDEALANGKSYDNLRYLCTQIGPRLSGSEGAAKAVDWTKQLMEGMGFDRVYLQEVMVPHWVRGEKEKARIKSKKNSQEVPICALGGSVGTGKKGLQAPVVEVKSFEELKSLGREKVHGKIVFYNRPMNQKFVDAFDAYSDAVTNAAAALWKQLN